MIFKKKKLATWGHRIESRKAEVVKQAGGDKATVESVLNVLFGSKYNEYEDNQYFVYGYDEETTKTKWWQRVNRVWFAVVFFIFILPFQWIIKGQVGVKENTKFGRFVLKLIGED